MIPRIFTRSLLMVVGVGGILFTVAVATVADSTVTSPRTKTLVIVAPEGTPVKPAAQSIAAQVVVSRGAQVLERVGYINNQQIVSSDTCKYEPFSSADGGFVVNHFSYCHRTTFILIKQTEDCFLGIFNCHMVESGRAVFAMVTLGTGWDHSMDADGSDPSQSQVTFRTRLEPDPFLGKTVSGDGYDIVFQYDVTCFPENPEPGSGPDCVRDPRFPSRAKTIAEWEQGEHVTRFLHNPSVGSGPDRRAYYGFVFYSKASNTGKDEKANVSLGNSFRCDAAPYARGGYGCNFHDMDEIFGKLSIEPGAKPEDNNQLEEAQHIHDAFYHPERTQPQPEDGSTKEIPGNVLVLPEKLRALRYVYEPEGNQPIRDANRAEAVRTCRKFWGDDYSQGQTKDCDEFPFASTLEGAARAVPPGNYSARPIKLEHNRSGGAILGNWYRDQRLLDGDTFFVWIRGTGRGGPGPDPDPGSNVRPSVNAGPDLTGAEGDTAALRATALDPDSTLSIQWTYTAGADVDAGATCTFTEPNRAATFIRCTDDGTYTVTLTVNDGVNAPVSDSAIVKLVNVAPTVNLTAPAPWLAIRAGTSLNLAATVSDPGTNDKLTCRVNWDDGTTDTYLANGTCNRAHTYAHAGMYTIALTVSDDDGGDAQAPTLAIAYDPNAGFTTAGGFIESPSGALASNPAATGKGHFTFNPKYHKGADRPEGHMHFALDGTNFTVESQTFDWLVVTPDGKIAAKGSGSVSGQSNYGFVVYGTSDPSRYRLLVWPLAQSSYPNKNLLYDNRASAPYDVDVADPQPIAHGAIQLHQTP